MLGAPRPKMSIGGFDARSPATLPALQERLGAAGIGLLIASDQSASAGTLQALRRFFCADRAAGLPLAGSAGPWRAVLRTLPARVPWAIEYPLAGDDLAAVTRTEVEHLRAVAAAPTGDSA